MESSSESFALFPQGLFFRSQAMGLVGTSSCDVDRFGGFLAVSLSMRIAAAVIQKQTDSPLHGSHVVLLIWRKWTGTLSTRDFTMYLATAVAAIISSTISMLARASTGILS